MNRSRDEVLARDIEHTEADELAAVMPAVLPRYLDPIRSVESTRQLSLFAPAVRRAPKAAITTYRRLGTVGGEEVWWREVEQVTVGGGYL